MTGLRKIKILIPSPTSHRCKGCLELLDMLSNFVIKEGIKISAGFYTEPANCQGTGMPTQFCALVGIEPTSTTSKLTKK